ncbi:class I SAM-dependent methyltransferase [Saltatorellus ferox]
MLIPSCLRRAPLAGTLVLLTALGGAHAQHSGRIAADQVQEIGRKRVYMGREIAQTMHWRGADWLMRETRENEENGQQLRAWLDVGRGASVADLGCGNGYHTIPLARAVGPEGRVFAVDLQPEMLKLLDRRVGEEAARLGTPLNVAPVVATIDNPHLPADSCDFVLMVDVYHELSHPRRVLQAVRESLREEGTLVLVEFRTEDKSVPIKPEHKMTKAQMIAEMAANGFVLAAETDELPWQHAMAFAPFPEPEAPADGSSMTPPPLGAQAMAAGFLDALRRDDPRIVAPFLDRAVMIDGGLPWAGKDTAVEIGRWMKAESAPLVPEGTKAELTRVGTGHVTGRLLPPEGQSVFEDRVLIELNRDENGLWLVDAWHAAP